MSERIKVLEKVLSANDRNAEENRRYFLSQGTLLVNVMGGPGSGKTALLEKLLPKLAPDGPLGVVEGDISTTADAERVAAIGVPVVQINTDRFGGECHLEAHAIRGAADQLGLDRPAFLFVENVGNLVCPAEFELGEGAKVAVLSVAEGEEKPSKYPLVFRLAHLVILSKIDLLPHLRYDEARFEKNLRQVNAEVTLIRVSAQTGEGIDAVASWMRDRRRSTLAARS